MTEPTDPRHDPLARLALLGEPVRRRVYEHAAAAGPVDRETVAAAAGIGRSLAAFHLDRLVEAGLLQASFRRRTGRSGPGAGRPAKFYARPPHDAIAVSLPPRRYELAAGLFAAGLERTADGRMAALEVAREAGLAAGRAATRASRAARRGGRAPSRLALVRLLDERAFEPRTRADGGIDLGNCPFRDLATHHRDLTCGANLALLAAMAESLAGAGLAAKRQDPPEPCCVTLRPADGPATLDVAVPQAGG